MTIRDLPNSEIDFFIFPIPKGSEENQFIPFRVQGKQIDFQHISLVNKYISEH